MRMMSIESDKHCTPTFLQRKRHRSMLVEQMRVLVERSQKTRVLVERLQKMIRDAKEKRAAPFDLPTYIQWARVHIGRQEEMLVLENRIEDIRETILDM